MPKKHTCHYNHNCYRINPEHYKKYHHDHFGNNYRARIDSLVMIIGKNPEKITDQWFCCHHLYWRFMAFTNEKEQIGFYQFINDKIKDNSLNKIEALCLKQLLHTMEEDNIRVFGEGSEGEPLSNTYMIGELNNWLKKTDDSSEEQSVSSES